jgi:hypothetical protein
MARRPFNVFSLSFLDVMACGLGATILFLVIISTQVRTLAERASDDLIHRAQVLQEEVTEGRENLLKLQESDRRLAEGTENPAGEIERLRRLIAELEAEQADREADSLAKRESVEELRADIQRLQEAKARLENQPPAEATGTRTRSFTGRGNRQYLTGMRMGGQRVLILVDSSASMMSRTYVNVIRYKAMGEVRQRNAPKWRQTVATVDWITTRMNPAANFQIYHFNETVQSTVPGTEGTWMSAALEGELDKAVAGLRKVTPRGGTSLYQAFLAASQLKPAPDNIFLITDGLPTVGRESPGERLSVTPAQRVNYFNLALRELPGRAPVNVILLPMDGDPDAAFAYWQLAVRTKGSLLGPSRDWP